MFEECADSSSVEYKISSTQNLIMRKVSLPEDCFFFRFE